MPNPLNYQPSTSAVYYTPKRRVHLVSVIGLYLVSMAGIVIGSIVYARLQPQIRNAYGRLIEVAIGAAAVGWLGALPSRHGRVRIPLLAAFIGASLALLALYVMWMTWLYGHLHPRFGFLALIENPMFLVRTIRVINRIGVWKYHGTLIRGVPLAICWVGEFAAILACGVLIPLKKMSGEDPICTSCGNKCKLVRPIARFADDRQGELIGSIESRDFPSVILHAPPRSDTDPQLSLRLLSCPKCGRTNVLTVNHISWATTPRGRTMDIRPLVNQLLVTEDEAGKLKESFKQIMEGRAAEEREGGRDSANSKQEQDDLAERVPDGAATHER